MNISSIQDKTSEILSRVKDTAGAKATQPAANAKEAQNVVAGSGSGNDTAELTPKAQALATSSVGNTASTSGESASIYDGNSTGLLDPTRSDVESIAQKISNSDYTSLDDFTVLSGTEGDDNIKVSQGKDNGLVVTINGEEAVYTSQEARKLIIDGAQGNDNISVDDNVTKGIYVTGGQGNDTIKTGSGHDIVVDNYGANNISTGKGHDTITASQLDYDQSQTNKANVKTSWLEKLWNALSGKEEVLEDNSIDGNVIDGGEGNDSIQGGYGNDYIRGRQGNDSIYGMSGNDTLQGGLGDDYIDGGKGNDDILGDSGKDKIFGGNGNDVIDAGKDDDVIVGGRGKDQITSGDGKDKITTTSGDVLSVDKNDTTENVVPMDIPKNIKPIGSDVYQERVTSDLDALAATSVGKTMLNALGDTGKSVTITQTEQGCKAVYYTIGQTNEDGSAGPGSDSTVYYDTDRIDNYGGQSWSQRPAILGLYHEMSHSYDAATGTLDGSFYDYEGTKYATDDDPYDDIVKGAEFQAVGIDNGTVKQNPDGISENALRAFLNEQRREKY